ncbi:MAG: signal peptidase I [Candidatus Nitrosopelagicus sp.]|nr:signal peptidase I [Candidatus Nitrosopelagicus sp.]
MTQQRSPFWYLLPIFFGIVGGIIAYLILKNMDSQKAKRALAIGIIISIPLFTWMPLQIAFGTQNPFYIISSNGMSPVLQVYDAIVVQGHVPFEEIEIGNIIVFNRPSDHNQVQVSRVVSVTDDNPWTVRTQSDANNASIPGTDFPITEEEYIGKVEYLLPQVGYVTQLVKPPMNVISILVFFGVVFGILARKHQEYKKNQPVKSQITKTKDETQFWVCPNCGGNTQMKESRQYCPSCKFYLSI